MLLAGITEPNSAKVKSENANSDLAVFMTGKVEPGCTVFRTDNKDPNIT